MSTLAGHRGAKVGDCQHIKHGINWATRDLIRLSLLMARLKWRRQVFLDSDPHVAGKTYDTYDPSTITNFPVPPRRQQRQRRSVPPADTPNNNNPSSTRPYYHSPARSFSGSLPIRQYGHPTRHSRHVSFGSIEQRLAPESSHQRPTHSQVPTFNTHHQRDTFAREPRQPSAEADASTDPDFRRADAESYWPERARPFSRHTLSAILWVLEEAIRKPFVFTPDLGELNASMSDLFAGQSGAGGPSNNSAESTRLYRNGASRPAQVPDPQSNHPHSGMRTPTDIMRRRREREEQAKAQREALAQAEREAKEREMHELQERERTHQAPTRQSYSAPQPERTQQAAGVAGSASQRRPGATTSRPPDVNLPQDPGVRSHPRPGNGPRRQGHYSSTAAATAALGDVPGTAQPSVSVRQPGLSQQRSSAENAEEQQQGRQQPDPSRAPQATSQPTQPAGGDPQPSRTRPQPAQSAGADPQLPRTRPQSPGTQQTQTQSQQQQGKGKHAFPHAFERWEMLSSHWEGLTSYWIRRLEQNNEELSKDPLSQQMSRQITDLSAAGANLFHAVVELQRLRASSERKFQRWFFDTRAEQERAQEVRAELERMLTAERHARTEAIPALKQAELDKAKAEELTREVRRELQISRDEARRAWEELGRREQEERDRTTSLRNGEPTIVGGVQVVPMLQTIPSRQASTNRPPTREGPYPGGPSATMMGGQAQTHRNTAETAEHGPYSRQVSSPTETDPFIETSRDPQYSQPTHHYGATTTLPQQPNPESRVQSQGVPHTDPERFYQHESSVLHGHEVVPGADVTESDLASEGDNTPVDRRGPEGTQLAYPRTISDDSDEYDTSDIVVDGSQYQYGGYEGALEHVSMGEQQPGYAPHVDYSGAGWGVGSNWDSVALRHRHPTRLSDVLEEDERSRTSPSRASQASRTLA
ncbi:hypothetical protein FQN57_006252 [Myotisia sp. PD_48]|nr:hypothetical protein FQN57_006252 [Myotisia sp. PD_48]